MSHVWSESESWGSDWMADGGGNEVSHSSDLKSENVIAPRMSSGNLETYNLIEQCVFAAAKMYVLSKTEWEQ